jgi:hypothetical protein
MTVNAAADLSGRHGRTRRGRGAGHARPVPRRTGLAGAALLALTACTAQRAGAIHTSMPAPGPSGSTAAAATSPSPAGSGAPAQSGPNSVRVPIPADSIGPLFLDGMGSARSCTGGVVDSPGGDVVVTAAHCLKGSAAGIAFAPGYRDGIARFGVWIVQRAYGPGEWLAAQDPRRDYAFLVVQPAPANRPGVAVEAAVGAVALGTAPIDQVPLRVRGYTVGAKNPLDCDTPVYYTQEFPTVYCVAFGAGTSGSPWIADGPSPTGAGDIVAVTGGREQGGCQDDVSYGAPFDASTAQVLARAVASAAADDFPSPNPVCTIG